MKSFVLDVLIVLKQASSEDLRLSHGGKRAILFLKILFRVEFCFVLLSAFLFLEPGFLCIVLAILELTL